LKKKGRRATKVRRGGSPNMPSEAQDKKWYRMGGGDEGGPPEITKGKNNQKKERGGLS